MKKKILLIRLSSLGDLVLLTSPLESLYRKGYDVCLLLHKEYSQLFEDEPRIKRIYRVERGIRGIYRTIRELREERFYAIFDLHFKPLSIIFLLFSRSEIKKIYKKRITARRMAVWFKKRIKDISVLELYHRPLTSLLGEVREFPEPMLYINSGVVHNLPSKYCVFAPLSRHSVKIWPYYKELYSLVVKNINMEVVLVGKEEDGSEISLDIEGAVNLINRTDLKELVQIIKGACFVVSNDSAVAHISTAVRTPLFVIFGPTIKEFGFMPQGENVSIFETFPHCRPCSLHGDKPCKYSNPVCLGDIKPDDVFSRILEFLGK